MVELFSAAQNSESSEDEATYERRLTKKTKWLNEAAENQNKKLKIQ